MSAANAPIDPGLRIGAVELAVSDVSRSADFYEHVLGLKPLDSGPDGARLGGEEARPLLELAGIAHPTQAPPARTGLFHVAWLHPSRADLADTVRRIAGAGWPIDGAADHGVSEALYLSDPDGLGIEIYADRPRSQWQPGAGGRGVRMVTLPLDVEDLLAQGHETPPAEIGSRAAIGHVHLKVADVPRTLAFYRDALGFEQRATMPSAAFLAAGGYHHHVGLNSWQSQGEGPAANSAPRLTRIEFELGDEGALGELEGRLHDSGQAPEYGRENGGLWVRDPDGELLAFRHR